MARLRGRLKTLIAYAWPMHRWIASAAGGTSQRLNPGPATIRSLESRPGMRRILPIVALRVWWDARRSFRAALAGPDVHGRTPPQAPNARFVRRRTDAGHPEEATRAEIGRAHV